MTEGIIQEVFKIALSDKELPMSSKLILIRTRKELIEKIKQEFDNYNSTCDNSKCDCRIREKLIGDNQE